MRKLLLSAILALATLSANAQQIELAFEGDSFSFVPAAFSCNNETIILEWSYEDGGLEPVTVMTGSLKGLTFSANTDRAYAFNYIDWDKGTFTEQRISFTQTIFNNDEDIEWVDYRNLYSSNGSVTPLPEAPSRPTIYKINNQYYWVAQNGLYLIKSETASVKAVPADAPEARLVYSLSGRRQSEMQQGVNIVTGGENGPRKVLKR